MSAKTIGILTAGGDSPGLNAAIRAVGKVAINKHGMRLVGFRDGFRGLMQNRVIWLGLSDLSGILTLGGTILGTSRDKPHKMPIGGKTRNMMDVMVEVYERHHLDALVCLGGGGTAKNAYRLSQQGLNVVCLPKTIDNDVSGTDVTFGFDTALNIATEAIDRLHSTAHSHHRIIVCEIMGHNTGWLALGAGLAGGADVILIPEIPFDIEAIANSIRERSRGGNRFSIVAVSEGAMTQRIGTKLQDARARLAEANAEIARCQGDKDARKAARSLRASIRAELAEIERERSGSTLLLTRELEKRTGLESRVTILGHVQRGGIPSPKDRLLATRLGTAAANFVAEGKGNIMVGIHGDVVRAVPLADVVGVRKNVPLDHTWLRSARDLEICLGD
ncbi:MAG: ATP-dependent 6-phosphofructokinase [Chloroflexi bacterium]|nr:ATP-dependent 6-phosphofructokinase [Chloroflexota bacterium]MCY3582303.1 ATP-dependent 6-phosphofructokinase [Chloroflexota bacterium]MCY3716167.1 ATP-dependent 6-phosphofructokinase [Chloroflexota bacterium]MDE2650941.1 ATP-dependent 6-phosphofructokinase [Chloroflexota bacterium]MXX50014.1 6-phosphofructokinase [Chloroflexota bacterium]